MKLKHLILFLTVVVAACSSRHPVETLVIPSESGNIASPNQQLQAIDSLMWRQPDSALMVMLDFAASPQADSLSTFDRHYCQLLISELLYKNYYAQSNREKLLKAVDYFDSLIIVLNDNPQPRSRHCGLGPQSPGQNDNIVFLDARAHYINGVGLYEQGCVVEACAEYLKALEVMEGHFGEEDLVKNKARFMAYTYNRLGDMFSGQFMMEAAITCYENVLAYCKIETTSPTGVSNALTRLGLQYEKLKDTKKMRAYYSQALGEMPDSDNLSYRDMTAAIALCDYKIDSDADRSLETLRRILSQAADENERLTRYLTIGAIFSHEEMYDSAVAYLEPVFRNTNDEISQIQAAEYLRKIYESLGNEAKLNECISFLVNRKASASENKALVSQLDNLFQGFVKQKQGKQTEAEHTKHIKRIVGIIVPIIVLLVLGVIVIAKLRSNKLLKQQQKEAEQELRLLQAEADKALEKSKRKHEEELRQLQDVSEKTLKEIQKKHDLALETVQADNALTAKKAKESLAERLKLIYKASTMNRNKVISDENDFEKVKRYLFGAKDATVWDAMKHCMDETYPNLYAQMAEAYPMFSDVELKICLLSAFKFRTDEIADIAELKNGTVSTYKTNIRKKVQNLPIDHIAEQFMD